MRGLLRLLKWAFSWLLALLILFEEWGWEPLQRVMARIGHLPAFAWVERVVRALPPYAALALFFLPALALLPVKIGALWLIAHGQRMLGLVIILTAKVLGTAILARLFALTQPALMNLPWFAHLFTRWTTWKEALLAWVRASGVWRQMRAFNAAARQRWRRWRSSIGN